MLHAKPSLTALVAFALLALLAIRSFTIAAADTPAPPAAVPSTQPAPAAETQVVKLSIIKSPDPIPRTVNLPHTGPVGTALTAQLSLDNALIIAAPKPFQITSFQDDKNTDLTTGLPDPKDYRRSNQTGNNPYVQIAEDRSSCEFELRTTSVPAPGAASLAVKGSIPLRVGIGEKKVVVKNQSLKLGQSFNAGDIQFTVQSISLNQRKGTQSIHLISDAKLENIRSITVADAQGKQISLGARYPSPSDPHSVLVGVPGPVTGATVTITFFESIANIDVPIDLKTNLQK